jgi:hypothetical protein
MYFLLTGKFPETGKLSFETAKFPKKRFETSPLEKWGSRGAPLGLPPPLWERGGHNPKIEGSEQ